MNNKIMWVLIFVLLVGLGWWGIYKFWPVKNPVGLGKNVEIGGVDYSKYDFDTLRNSEKARKQGKRESNTLEIGERIEEVDIRRKNLGYTTDEYGFDSRQISFLSQGKKISGMINYQPWKSSLSPVVIMVRGYAEKEGYYSGSGTWRVADQLAKAGYMTISLDFLGFGESGAESVDMLEARFEKVENVLDLLMIVENLAYVDKNNIYLWAHSNGGQIVLSVLEISGGNYPTVLWAPMTNPFPQSVLSTIEEGSPVKAEIERFMKYYDERRYAFENYYSWINAPVLILQGDNDSWCEVEWQEKVVGDMVRMGRKAELVVIEGADHNMAGKWEEAVGESIKFYEELLVNK